MKADKPVPAAMHHHYRDCDPWQLAESIVVDRSQPADGQPGKELRAYVRHTGESALENQPTRQPTQGQFGPYSTTERFAINQDVSSCEAFVLKPLLRCNSIQIVALLAWASLAAAITTVIKCEDIHTGSQKRLAHFKSVADIPCVSVTEQHHQGDARRVFGRGKKPAV